MTNVSYSRDAAAGASKVNPVAIPSAVWPVTTVWSRIVATISNPDLIAIGIFCAIGLLATANLMLNGFDIATI